jgi:hypothetical protein
MASDEDNAGQNFWAPLYWPTRAALVLLGHVLLSGILVTCIWGTARYVHWLYEPHGVPKLYGWIPLEWAFDTMDAGVLVLFLVWGLIEANRALQRR